MTHGPPTQLFKSDYSTLSAPNAKADGATLDYDFLALHRMLGTAEGREPERSWAHALISVFDPQFESSSFLFIDITGISR
jgi:hypothetical protein